MEYLTDGNKLTVLVKSTLFKLEMRNKYWYPGAQLRGEMGGGGGGDEEIGKSVLI